MDFKTKIKYGEELAENLLNGKNLEELKKGLLNGELYEKDVQNLVGTSLNILKEKIGPTIQSHLLNDSVEGGVKEFQQVAGEVMKDIIKEQATALGKQQEMLSLK